MMATFEDSGGRFLKPRFTTIEDGHHRKFGSMVNLTT
jgi:hypothetical protein